jgi:hypothetical protein
MDEFGNVKCYIDLVCQFLAENLVHFPLITECNLLCSVSLRSSSFDIVTNKSDYRGFPPIWFIYSTVTMVLQLFTIGGYRFTIHCQCRLTLLLKRPQ